MRLFKTLSVKAKSLWKILGPGIITGASDDDPSGISTYSQAGASFGLATLWTAWITVPLMSAMQEMCARIGVVTSSGLTGVIKQHYPRYVLYLMIALSFPAITLNIGADIAAIGAVSNLLFPRIPAFYFSLLFTVTQILLLVYLSHNKITSILKYLCMALFVYMVIPFLSHQDWHAIAKATLIPSIKFNKEFISILVAILGTTISPYLFFWQTTMAAEEIKHVQEPIKISKRMLSKMGIDIDLGMLFSNIIMFFIILTAGTILYNGGMNKITTVEEAARVLQPLGGSLCYVIFTVGIIGTGFLAIPILSSSLSYIVAETFDWPCGFDNKFHEARSFYFVMSISLVLGLLINFIGISPIQALVCTAILYGITAPVIIAIILVISNNKEIMGEHTNGVWSNILGVITLLVMTTAALFLLYYHFYAVK